MNEMSNGPVPRRALNIRRELAAALFGGFAVSLAGCPGPTPQTGTAAAGGSGGDGTTSNTSSSSSSTSSSSTSSSSTSSSTGGVECTTAAECKPPSTACEKAVCKGNMCGFEPLTKGMPCSDTGGQFCDGAGKCVACIEASDCGNTLMGSCVGTMHTSPDQCVNGVCEDSKQTDCGMAMLTCKQTGCEACTFDAECGPAATLGECVQPQCDINTGKCAKAKLPPGTACTQSGGTPGVCTAVGVCLPGKLVFVTAGTHNADFGGTMKTDDACRDAALAAGLDGEWNAWTSELLLGPLKRFSNYTGPYFLLDGNLVTMNLAQTTAMGQGLAHPIDVTENNDTLTAAQPLQVWTGTKQFGSPVTGGSCNDWGGMLPVLTTGTVGRLDKQTSEWTIANTSYGCDQPAHLYCFQQ